MKNQLESLLVEITSAISPDAESDKSDKVGLTVRIPHEQMEFINALVKIIGGSRNVLFIKIIQIGIEQLREKLPANALARIEELITPKN
jgi:hypothetical protein